VNRLPPFPVDDATLDLLAAAIDPRGYGDRDAKGSSVWGVLEMLAELGGSDLTAVEEVIDEGLDGGATIQVMRDQHYHEHNVIKALIDEVRRLRAKGGTE
jgi:hypothetical protein